MLRFLLILVYILGFLTAAVMTIRHAHDSDTGSTNWDQPWVPGIARRDACAMPFFPVFFLLPAILWPLILAGGILLAAGAGLCMMLSSATSCCGIPLPRGDKKQAGGDGELPGDLEMGAGSGSAEGGDGRAAEGSDKESEHPPSYASLGPREDGDGEADGLLGQGAK
ncbi:hypothetical protein KVR01_002685 [Diaporthe batatas]|uniref:uncharacterized protein n=1 Tax=Diaporthe batatas TaxID=748121 RepID=UPI001D04A90F|nr:uncharacterized protein KVR01_002685 [Diaporthe batatas]KAG8166996.1 hypothetical protein KVR01_002685 [Diaporthe batatas]